MKMCVCVLPDGNASQTPKKHNSRDKFWVRDIAPCRRPRDIPACLPQPRTTGACWSPPTSASSYYVSTFARGQQGHSKRELRMSGPARTRSGTILWAPDWSTCFFWTGSSMAAGWGSRDLVNSVTWALLELWYYGDKNRQLKVNI